MFQCNGGVKSALGTGWLPVVLALMFPTVSLAYSGTDGPRYVCNFARQCSGTERPCEDVEFDNLVLEKDDDGWHLWGSDETWFGFTPVHGGSDELLSWVSNDIDPSAQATALLSVAGNGQAFLSIHGVFLTPEIIVQTGTCTRKDRQ